MVAVFVILAITIILFIAGRIRADIVALLSVIALYLSGVIDVEQALSGFGDPTVIMIAALFVVGEGLARTGVTAWLGERLLGLAGRSPLRLLVVLMAGTAALSAFISNTGTVATLMPAVTAAAWHIGSLPSKFLMPLAFAANTGGLLTLTGTPPNIIVNNILIAAGLAGFGYFEFGLIGLPLLLAAVAYMALIGRRRLPARSPEERPLDLVRSVGELAEEYTLPGYFFWLRVRYGSGLVGKTLEEAALGRDFKVSVLRIERPESLDPRFLGLPEKRQSVRHSLEKLQAEGTAVPGPETVIRARDMLLVKASRQAVEQIMLRYNVGVQEAETADDQLAGLLLTHEAGLAEVLLTPRSAYTGRSLSESQIARKFNVQVLSIRRQEKQLDPATARLQFGDALLVRGRWQDIEHLRRERRNFVVVGSPEAMARQVVELSPQSIVAALALVGMIILMVSGLVPVVFAALMAALVMVLGRCLTMEQAYRAISWSSVVLIAAMIPMSVALQVTGGAELLANGLVKTLGAWGPLALTAGVFLLTTAFSQVINNSATAVLVAPIVLQAAVALGLSPYPLLMAVTVSASTAFLTPIGTTTNLMVSTPGGYSFGDFLRTGLPLVIIFLLLTLLLAPLIWPF